MFMNQALLEEIKKEVKKDLKRLVKSKSFQNKPASKRDAILEAWMDSIQHTCRARHPELKSLNLEESADFFGEVYAAVSKAADKLG